ncbi:MAG: hypothetical protein FVQ81_14540 [Candidatus Glassbacteria bacterium]|nr:hypothetical protein [Candidatus Glassbacteria bacterium]
MSGLMKNVLKIFQKNPQIAEGASAVGTSIIKTGISFVKKPAVIAYIKHIFHPKKLGKYSTREVREVEINADWIAGYIKEKNIRPGRVGIDGLPGSGKSTLANALSDRLKMEWISLDYELTNEPCQLNRNRSIYEHHRLFRTQDLDVFDLIIFIDLPVEKIKEQIIERGQGAVNVEIFDYNLMQEIGRTAFELADGEKIRVTESHLYMKIRPAAGFNIDENLDEMLKTNGFLNTDILSKEEKLFLLIEGKAKKGLFAYNQGGKYAMELLDNIGEFYKYVDCRRYRRF